jgi:hypothetical protein
VDHLDTDTPFLGFAGEDGHLDTCGEEHDTGHGTRSVHLLDVTNGRQVKTAAARDRGRPAGE